MKHNSNLSFKELQQELSQRQYHNSRNKPLLVSALDSVSDYRLPELSAAMLKTTSAIEANIMGWAYLKRAEAFVYEKNNIILNDPAEAEKQTKIELSLMSVEFSRHEIALASGKTKNNVVGIKYIRDHYDMLDTDQKEPKRSIIGSIRSALKL